MFSGAIQSRVILGATACALLAGALARGEVLLDERWSDGSRAETKRPREAATWVGREADVTVKAGALTTAMTPSSQKIWTYFTDKEPIELEVGERLVASVSFIPRGVLNQGTSRSFRFGVFHDPTDPRVEMDVNSDGGGSSAPWRDATGYAMQLLLTSDDLSTTKPFDLGKRIDFESPSLLGTSGSYVKVSGGEPAGMKIDQEYTATLTVERVSEKEIELIAELRQGDSVLSTWSVFDDGSYLGTEPIFDKFDMLYVRIADRATTADQIEITSFKVERQSTKTTAQ